MPGTTCQALGTAVLASGRPAPWKKHLELTSGGAPSAVTDSVLRVVGTGAGRRILGQNRCGQQRPQVSLWRASRGTRQVQDAGSSSSGLLGSESPEA